VHGFPNNIPLKDGDIVSLDVGVYKNGFHGDHAYTFVIGEAPAEHLQLVKVTKESLYKGIEQAVSGNRVGDIGFAIQQHTEKQEYRGIIKRVIKEVGKNKHKIPYLPNNGWRG